MSDFLPGNAIGNPSGLSDTQKTKMLRERMVQFQVIDRGIKDQRVLAAMKEVPRHWFCRPDVSDEDAYGDYPLPIGWGQTISQPYMVADMLEQLRLTGAETVLEVGTGSGYNAALLGRLASRVVSLEIVPDLAQKAQKLLQMAGFGNVEIHIADGSMGWQEEAPYDSIVVTAGAPVIPSALQDQLRMGGRLVIPVGDRMIQELLVIQKTPEGIRTDQKGGCRFVPLQGKDGWR